MNIIYSSTLVSLRDQSPYSLVAVDCHHQSPYPFSKAYSATRENERLDTLKA